MLLGRDVVGSGARSQCGAVELVCDRSAAWQGLGRGWASLWLERAVLGVWAVVGSERVFLTFHLFFMFSLFSIFHFSFLFIFHFLKCCSPFFTFVKQIQPFILDVLTCCIVS